MIAGIIPKQPPATNRVACKIPNLLSSRHSDNLSFGPAGWGFGRFQY